MFVSKIHLVTGLLVIFLGPTTVLSTEDVDLPRWVCRIAEKCGEIIEFASCGTNCFEILSRSELNATHGPITWVSGASDVVNIQNKGAWVLTEMDQVKFFVRVYEPVSLTNGIAAIETTLKLVKPGELMISVIHPEGLVLKGKKWVWGMPVDVVIVELLNKEGQTRSVRLVRDHKGTWKSR